MIQVVFLRLLALLNISDCAHSAENRIERLEQGVRDLLSRIEVLNQENSTFRKQEALSQQSRKEYQDAISKIQKLQSKNAKYRTIIIKSQKDETVMIDSEVQSAFRELRDLTQRIAHRYYISDIPKLSTYNNDHMLEQKKFRAELKEDPEAIRIPRIRAKIFECLYKTILSFKSFGVSKEKLLG